MFAVPGVSAGGEPSYFDIPAQPLASALQAFSTVSGYQILVADDHLPQSMAIKGVLSSKEALARLVAGTGMSVSFTGPQAAILVPGNRSQNVATTASSQGGPKYDAALQYDVLAALCRDAMTRPGQYRTALDLWMMPSGRVGRAELLSSTGDPERDRRILAVLYKLKFVPPPQGLSQPTTLLLLPSASDADRLCDSMLPAAHEATAR
jgi:TonB family protein